MTADIKEDVAGFDQRDGVLRFSGVKIVVNEALTESYVDWSMCRSPARARRRLDQGYKQRVEIKERPKREVVDFTDPETKDRYWIMHPEILAQFLKEHNYAQQKIAADTQGELKQAGASFDDWWVRAE